MANQPRDDAAGMYRLDALLRLVQEFEASGMDREAFLVAHEDVREQLEALLEDNAGDDVSAGPDQVGDFELVRVLGRGGSGIVYEAIHVATDQPAAVKKLIADVSDDRVRVRFQREARLCASVRHENVVRLLSAGIHFGQPYLAMELVRGVPLSGVLAELAKADTPDAATFWVVLDRQLDAQGFAATREERAVRSHEPLLRLLVDLLRRVALALHAVHAAGIVHRDVKPANVLVCGDGKPVLTDFGVARAEGELGITLTGEATGTPYYLAPEQHEVGADRLTARTDVFSLGVTLYEAITRRRPFEGPSRLALAEQIKYQRPVDPRRLAADVDRDLAAITMKAVEKAPRDRYPSTLALAADLDAWLRGGSVLARPMPLWQRGVRWVRRNPLPTSVGVALAGAAATMAWLGMLAEARATQLEEKTTRLRQTRVLKDIASWTDEVRSKMQRHESMVADHAESRARHERLQKALSVEPELRSAASVLQSSDADMASTLLYTAQQLERQAGWAQRSLDWLEFADRWERASEAVRGDLPGWDDVQHSISRGEASPLYSGLSVKPQVGLVPLRCNPDTKFWEFWHAPSGERPKYDSALRRWVVEPETGLVFVLIPRFETRAAFFLAAHELTQAQWDRLRTPDLVNASLHPRLSAGKDYPVALHPLDTVAPWAARAVLRAWGLDLPMEADWANAERLGREDGERSFAAPECYLNGTDFMLGGRRTTRHVGLGRSHRQGCHDLIGNVREIVLRPDSKGGVHYWNCGGGLHDTSATLLDGDGRRLLVERIRDDIGTSDIGVRACRLWLD